MMTMIEQPFARAIEEAQSNVEDLTRQYLKRWGWSMTSHTPGSYWLWRRDWTTDDEAAVARWHEREATRAAEIAEHGRPHTPNGRKPPEPYGIIMVPEDLAVSMTMRCLDQRAEDAGDEDQQQDEA